MGRQGRPKPRPLPISAYLSALVVLFVVTAALGVGYARRRETSAAVDAALVQVQYAAGKAAASMSSALSDASEELRGLASAPDLYKAFRSGCSLSFAGAGPFLAGEVDVLRPDGTVACSSLGTKVRARYTGQQWLAQAKPVPELFGPVRDAATGKLAVVEAVRGQRGALIAVFLDLQSLGTGLGSLYGGPQHLLFLVTNAAGTEILSRSLQPARWAGASLVGTAFARGGQSPERRGVAGTRRIFGVAGVAGVGWRVYAGYDEARALASARQTFDRELYIIIAGLLVCVLAAYLFSKRVTLPVQRLAAAVRARAAGHGPERVPVAGPTEVMVLAEGFNALIEAVDAELVQRKRAEESYRHLFSHNPQPMWVYDLTTMGFLAVNSAAVEQYGYSREELLRMRVGDLFPEDQGVATLRALPAKGGLFRSGPWRHVKADGKVIEVELSSHRLRFGERDAGLVMAENVTQRQLYERQLREMALRDELTGLANRGVLLDRLEEALARASSSNLTAVLVCGLDRFRDINSVHGHLAGDSVLREAASRLGGLAPPGATVGRVAAADFALVLERLDAAGDAVALARRVESVFSAPFDLEAGDTFVTASTGIVIVDHPCRAEEALRDALAAMHQAKASGGDRFEIFNEAIRERTVARAQMAADLRRAVERGQLRLYYQPEVDLASGRCSGAEALMRWAHPTRGLVGPSDFIPLAEETGVIVSLGRWALHEACRQAAEWAGAGAGPPHIAVNVSAVQLAQPDLVSQVTEALDQAGVGPGALCLELTETALMQDAPGAVATLGALRDLGVKLSIDDFGTGYSSLLYLRRYSVDFLKIDRAFVAGLGSRSQDDAIAAGVIGLGHSFGLRVVAEGVETPSQLTRLRDMGCDLAQGYLWSRPVPPDELLRVLASPLGTPGWH